MIRRPGGSEKTGEEGHIAFFRGRVDQRDDFMVAVAGRQFAGRAAKVVGLGHISTGVHQQNRQQYRHHAKDC